AATLGFPFDASDLNLPSIGIAELVGSQTIMRTVTSVDESHGRKRYRAIVDAPPGIDVSVSPSSIRLRGGETATYEVTFSVTDETVFDEWAFGSLTWKHGGTTVRSPIAIRPVKLTAPDELRAEGTDGMLNFDVNFGYTGDYQVNVDGLTDGNAMPDAVPDGGDVLHFFAVPPGTTLLRVSLFDEDTGDGSGTDDLDLQVFGPDVAGFPFLGQSAGPTSEEEFNVPNPVPGVYAAFVIEFATAGDPTPYTLFNFNMNGMDAGNTMVTAPSAVSGTTGTVTVDWMGLAPDTRHLGLLNHSDGTDTIGTTELLINTQ
ncbi:MAG: S8 family serine peptidase, partial [Gammaproteobacteria bacterium]